jgi:putative peptidoglycan lipid II flippase
MRGLLGIILVKTLAPASMRSRTSARPSIATGVLIATQLMNWLFVPYLQVAGLALSIGLGACLNAGFLFAGLRKRGIYMPKPGWPMFCLKLVIACVLMGAAARLARTIDWIGMQQHPLLRIGALLLVIGVCA